MRFVTLTLALTAVAGGRFAGAQQTGPWAQGKTIQTSVVVFPSTASAIERGGPARANRGVAADSQPGKRKAAVHPALEQLAAQRILVLPVQAVVFTDSLGWGNRIASVRSYLQTVDDEITYALKDRGLDGKWVLADAVVRSAKRNSDFAADPHSIDTRQLRPGAKTDEFLLREPLASQLRSLTALNDARYVLVPVEVRVVNTPGAPASHSLKTTATTNTQQSSGAVSPRANAVLHVVVIDTRRSQLQWVGDVVGAPLTKFSPALAADLASRLADLIAPAN
jgi:hypothetical protein